MQLHDLCGIWQGLGQATYPTIQPADYREVMTISPHADDNILQLEQKTWRIHPDGKNETLLHWEFGFIRHVEDEVYLWNNTQNNGRVEVLQGKVITQQDTLVIVMKSLMYGNDPRMVSAIRHLEFSSDQLRYSMHMATQNHTTLTFHLSAELERACSE